MSAALSNPKTQIINVVSTANNMFLRPAQSWVGSKLTWGMDDFTKAQMKEHGEDIAILLLDIEVIYMMHLDLLRKHLMMKIVFYLQVVQNLTQTQKH